MLQFIRRVLGSKGETGRFSGSPFAKFLVGASVIATASAIAFLASSRAGLAPPTSKHRPPRALPPVLPAGPVEFVDITRSAGINFQHNSGAFGLKWMPETFGSGVAFLDFNGDGAQDLFFVNSRDWTPREIAAYKAGAGREHQSKHGFTIPDAPSRKRTTGALYRNRGDGTFEDVTQGSGLDIEMYGMGAAVGDYDNDGRDDLLVTALERNFLFHNEGEPRERPRFRDVTQTAGVGGGRWNTASAWVDYDRDGDLDLFTSRYVAWSPQIDEYAEAEFGKNYMGPQSYGPQASFLFRNDGAGRFSDVSRGAGISVPTPQRGISAAQAGPRILHGKGLGVALCDENADGWPDLLVSHDTMPNQLFRNRRNGTFIEVARRLGVAFGPYGRPRAGMGIDAADVDNSGRETVLVGNYAWESIGFFSPQPGGFYQDASWPVGIGQPSRQFTTFGCTFLDIDNDGRLDILSANGHVQDDIDLRDSNITYLQRPLLLHTTSKGTIPRYTEIGFRRGVRQPEMVGRGLASADIDLDGDLDVVITGNGTATEGRPMLLRNEGGNRNTSLRIVLRGARRKGKPSGTNRSAIGALIEASPHSTSYPARSASSGKSQKTMRRMVRSGSSYLSQSELPVTLGLDAAGAADITVRWPSGATTRLPSLVAGATVTIEEGRGIIARRPFKRR